MEITKRKKYLEKQKLNEFFIKLESEKNPKKINAYLTIIGLFQEYLTKKQLEIIYSFENSNSLLIRDGLVSAIMCIQTNKAINITIRLMNDRFEKIRYWSTFNLVNHIKKDNKNIRIALWNRINDKSSKIKKLAILGLAKRKEYKVKEILRKEFIDNPDIFLLSAIHDFNDIELLELSKENIKRISEGNLEWETNIIKHTNKLIKKIKNERLT